MLRESLVKSKKMPWLVLVASLAWLGLTGFLYSQAVQVNAEHSLELEHTRLSTMAQQLMDARNWNAAHGGVYVEKSDYGQPNPWLPESERTVATQDGRTLVLVNPAYMSRQLAERSSREGVTISVISSAPLRPENMADVWEKSALARCAEETPEVFTAPQSGNGQSLRLLSVLMAQQSCLRCHTNKKVGEVLGGISVSQDASSFHRGLERQRYNMRLLYGLLAFTGVLAIGGLTFNLTHRRWLAEEASRMKSSFMGHLSHDMRTPLTAIVGMSELAQRTDLPEKERKKALGYLAQAAEALREMVGDITDHAALEQGTPTLEALPFDLRECLASCVNLYRPIADSKGLSLTLGLDEKLPQCAVGDSFRLRQALGNIVSNAVKFTEAGSVRIYATALESTSEHLKLAISVTDTGPGMSQEDQARVFESFQRGSDTARTPGTGLGLNIARTLARLMGGDVNLASRTGQGACFTLHVRLLQCAQPEQATSIENVPKLDVAKSEAQDSATHLLARKKVLVAEDTASIAYAMQHMLRGMGAEPVVAETGEKALEQLRDPHQGHWDLLVLDSRLPGIDGLEVLRALRNGDTLSPAKTLAVVYTATTSDTFLRQCEALGADGVFLKPLSFEQLRHELEKLVTAKSGEKSTDCPGKPQNVTQEKSAIANMPETAVTEHQYAEIQCKAEIWNRNAALEALDGDEDVLKSLANVLEHELHERLQALNIAISTGDLEQLRRTAHACKNSAGVMRLDHLRVVATAIESAESGAIAEEAQKLRSAMQEAVQALTADVEQGKTA